MDRCNESDHPASAALDALADDVRRSLRYLGDDPPNWVPPRDDVDHDVVIVGAGQTGVALAFALRRAGIARTLVIDAQPAGSTGTWSSHARMRTLRTPKGITGPELGVPSLSFRAWHAAVYGADAFDAVERIPLRDWSAYIGWYQRMVDVKPRYDTQAQALGPHGEALRIETSNRGGAGVLRCRKVILAMGMVGAGEPAIPAVLRQGLPATRYAHTDQPIDFNRLVGKRVAVIGAASSAFDAAGLALECGAADVHLFCRGDDIANVAKAWPLGYPGAGDNFFSLSDADRWLLGRLLRARAPGPMPETIKRATRHPNFHLHLAARLASAEEVGHECRLLVGGTALPFDFVIAGTGYDIDPMKQPLLSAIGPAIATWSDRYTPPQELAHEAGGRYPYLGPGYEFLEREAGSAPWLKNVHCFNFAAIMSYGRTVGDIASLHHGVPRLVASMSRDFFLDDGNAHLARMTAPPAMELTGEEYAHALWRREMNPA